MLHKGNYIKRLMKRLNVKQEEITNKANENYVGFGRNTLINLLKLSDFISDDDIEKARAVLITLKANQEDFDFIFPPQTKENAKYIGHHTDDDTSTTPIKEISPGYYILTAELVPIHAQAGYLLGFQDQEYIDMLPKYTTTVDKFVKGKYRHFEVAGDSMDNGDIKEAIPDGTVLLCREIGREHWTSKFHTHNWPNYVIVHKTEGIVVKQIASQDLNTGELVLRSLNPNKDKYPDFTIKLDDVMEIYNVIKRILV